MVGGAVFKEATKNHSRFFLALCGCLIIVAVAGALIYSYDTKKSSDSNTAQSLMIAKEALARDPNNIDKTLTVAYLTRKENPMAAKQYFIAALAKFKQQNNPDVAGKSTITYWAAAGLAQQAGEVDQAKHYYQEVIQTASPTDNYAQDLAEQSKAELARMQ